MTSRSGPSCRKRRVRQWLRLSSPYLSPLDPDVDATARPERASVRPPDYCGGNTVVIADDQPLRLRGLLIVVAVVLPRRGLVAQAELQAAAAGLQTGVVQRLLQLRRVLLEHRQ